MSGVRALQQHPQCVCLQVLCASLMQVPSVQLPSVSHVQIPRAPTIAVCVTPHFHIVFFCPPPPHVWMVDPPPPPSTDTGTASHVPSAARAAL